MLKQLWAHRGLILTLIRRQYQLRYRQSALGWMWAFLVPLATLGTGSLVFKGIAHVDTGGHPYELFTMSALVPWVFFASSLSFGIGSITFNNSLVMKLAFPRGTLPLSMIGASLLDFTISGLMFILLAVVSGLGLKATAVWVPALLVIEIALLVGLTLFGSALNVFARDIRLGIPLLMQVWLLVTPVLYPLQTVPPTLRQWIAANPMTGLVESFRRVLIDGRGPDLVVLGPTLLATVIAMVVGCWYFSATENRFADVI